MRKPLSYRIQEWLADRTSAQYPKPLRPQSLQTKHPLPLMLRLPLAFFAILLVIAGVAGIITVCVTFYAVFFS